MTLIVIAGQTVTVVMGVQPLALGEEHTEDCPSRHTEPQNWAEPY